TDRPVAAAAQVMLGAAGATLVSLGVLVSCYGYLSANILGFPRILFAMAERGDMPAVMARVHARFRTPHLAILAFALLLYAFSAAGSFEWNLFISAMSRLIYYGSVCAALPVLRRKRHVPPAQFRLPMGEVFSVLAVVAAGVAVNTIWASRKSRGQLAQGNL